MIQTLKARPTDDLQWTLDVADVYWHLDLGLESGPLSLHDPFLFNAHVAAIEHFTLHSPQQMRGVILYKGPLNFMSRLEEGIDQRAMGEYLHRLASFLPESMTPYCLFECSGNERLVDVAHLLTQSAFCHLKLALKNSSLLLGQGKWRGEEIVSLDSTLYPLGLCLPADPFVYEKKIETVLASKEVRIIQESRLIDEWEGLQQLLVIPEALSAFGKRSLQGFIAAGGEVIAI